MNGVDQTALEQLAEQLGKLLLANGQRLAVAESCTGGWVAQCVTAIAGSSEWFERGYITYSNDAKQEMLGVAPETLVRHGAVSEATALEMAAGALQRSHADWALAITGVAGPSGGSAEKPVGTVCFAWAATDGRREVETCHFKGNRQLVRAQSVARGLNGLLERAATLIG